MISARLSNSLAILLLFGIFSGISQAQSLTLLSGNGQLIATQALSNAPMVVQAKDASGRPIPNVAITWAITNGSGTITGATPTTDANGQASTNFLSTSLQPGASFLPATVTATSSLGTVNFVITTVVTSSLQPEVSIQLTSPTLDNPVLVGASGSTIPAGVSAQVVVAGGAFSGAPIPNVSMQMVDAGDPSTPPAGSCAGPGATALTNSGGIATCDLMITGAPGNYELRALVGGVQYTRAFSLTVTPGSNCRYSLPSSSQSFGPSGGMGAVSVVTGSGCGWTASTNAGFIAITSAASGTGSGSVTYTVAANSGAARTGTLTVAGQTYTVNQAVTGGPSPLTIPAQTLPTGLVGTAYQTTLTATGGTPPYAWSPTGAISTSGLSLQANGNISGTPLAAGTYSFTAIVADNGGARQSQSFTITVNGNTPPPSGFTITNTSFPSGVVGQVYPSQLLFALGGCVTPFSPQPGFTVSQGALPAGLSIQVNSDGSHSIAGTPTTSGQSQFTLQATDACAHTATANFTITITGTPSAAQIIATPSSLAFTVQAGAAGSPAAQTLNISSNGSTVDYAAAVSTASGGNWLTASGSVSGNTPGSFTVGVANFTSLSAGTYNGTITITSSAASNSPLILPVTLTVLAAAPLTVSPTTFTVNATVSSSATPSRQALTLASGTTPLTFTASAATNSGGTWLSVSANNGTTPTTLTAIVNPSGLAVGQYTGSITILPSSGAVQIVNITLIVSAPASLTATPAPLAFTYQQGASAPVPQSVAVNSSGTPLGVSLSIATKDGASWLSATPPNGMTMVDVSVSVSPIGLAPGSYSGSITVVPSDPSVAPLTIPVSLTIAQAAPLVNATTNSASFAPGPVAPGEIVTIFGTGMGPSTLLTLQLTNSGTVNTNLGGTQVFFDGYPAPIIYSSATQVSVIVPYEIAGAGTTSMLIEYQGIRSSAVTVPVLDSLPGIFTSSALGYGQGAIVNQDGTVNSGQNGADPGSVVSIYATGGGQTDPPSVDGTLATAAVPTHLPVTVQIGGEAAQVLYAGAAPGEPAGVIQVNAMIPADIPRGTNASVVITVGTVSSQAGVTLAIKQ